MVKYTGRGLVVKRPGVFSKVQMLTLVLGVGVFSLLPKFSSQKRSGDPNPQYFTKVLPYKWGAYCRTNGRRTAVQMGGVLQGCPFFEA